MIPGSANPLLFHSADGGYQISRSLRFRSSASAYLSRTFGTATDTTKWTYSCWVKRSPGSYSNNFQGGTGTTDATWCGIDINTSDVLRVSGWATLFRSTTRVFRDPSAWYHIIVAFDSGNATADNRIRIYVNGVEETSFTTKNNPSAAVGINSAASHRVGWNNGSNYDNCYLAEVNFIDGQALTPSSFGENDATTGVWKPKAYTGTYGTNGFYLKFTDIGSTTAGGANTGYGKDFAGTNNWTTNNLNSTSTSTSYDSMLDSPTPYDNGGTGVGNYCVMNPLNKGSNITLSAANLDWSNATADAAVLGTIGVTSGKWYWEFTASSASGLIGIATASASLTAAVGANAYGWGYLGSSGNKYTNNTSSAYGSSYTTNDVIAVAFDADNGALYFGKISSGTITWQNSGDPTSGSSKTGAAFTGLTSGPYFPAGGNNGASGSMNFGQRPFSATPPSGFKALNTQNLPTPTIAAGNKYFDATTYTGNGSSLTVTNAGGFQPDLVWIKIRSQAYDHDVYDALRPQGSRLITNATNAEGSTTTIQLNAFNANGFSLGSYIGVNENNSTFVGWQWKGGNGTVSNTSGSITSTVSANVTAGFSVVTYTGTGANATVGHGLGVAPSMIIVKQRTASSTTDWAVWHTSLANTEYVLLNTTAAKATGTTYWNSTTPDSSKFAIGTAAAVNASSSATYVAYCFAAVSGYSAFGSYTGNGSADGPFVFTGFRPRYVMVKRTDATSNWFIHDTARDTYNVSASNLYAELSNAEDTNAAGNIDFLSNGFKSRTGSGSNPNVSGGTYIYMAFAENPLKYSLAR